MNTIVLQLPNAPYSGRVVCRLIRLLMAAHTKERRFKKTTASLGLRLFLMGRNRPFRLYKKLGQGPYRYFRRKLSFITFESYRSYKSAYMTIEKLFLRMTRKNLDAKFCHNILSENMLQLLSLSG